MRPIRWDILTEFYVKILPYILVTLEYVIGSVFVGTIIGAVIAKGRLSKKKIVKFVAGFYVTIMRCVPSIVLLFLVYYGVPMILEQQLGILLEDDDAIVYVIVTFSLLLGASISEILRTAYLSVPKGQYEAALMVGLSPLKAFLRIIVPQTLSVAIPNYGNIFIFMMKEGALAYTLGLQDVFGRGVYLNGLKANVFALETYIALTLVYWPCTMLLEVLFHTLEKHLKKTKSVKSSRKKIKIRRVVEEHV